MHDTYGSVEREGYGGSSIVLCGAICHCRHALEEAGDAETAEDAGVAFAPVAPMPWRAVACGAMPKEGPIARVGPGPKLVGRAARRDVPR